MQANEARRQRALAGVVSRLAVIDRRHEHRADLVGVFVVLDRGAIDQKPPERRIVPLELHRGQPLAIADAVEPRLGARRGGGRQRERQQQRAGGKAPCSGPRARGLGLFLEAVDLGGLLLGQADVVEPVEHAVLAVRIDVELHHAAVGPADFLLLQVDRERGVGAALGVVEQLLQVLRR